MQSGFRVLAFRGRSSSHVGELFACVGCRLRTKMHMGFLLREYHCPLATWGVSEKGSHVARPQSTKVLTCGFSVKKEGVWRELSRTGADSWIFGEKGRCVARAQRNRCRLADFQRKRKSCGMISLPFFTTRQKRKVGGTTSARKSANSQIFSKKGNCVA